MRVATFNISSGRAGDGRTDTALLGDAVRTLDADLLSLQEVDRDQPRSGGADLTRVVAEAMGAAHHVFAPALFGTPGGRWTAATDHAGTEPDRGPAYGCALVSRLPLHGVEVLRIPTLPVALPLYVPGPGLVLVREEPRVAIVAGVETGDGRAFTVVATHLPFVPVWKQWQLRKLAESLRGRPDPVLLLGDLNLRRDAAVRASGYASLAAALTFPAARPRLQLDHVLLRGPAEALGPVLRVSTPEVPVSDHRPLVVDVGPDLG
ncbi:endonuclease/exonuclease/phosphatase family protein [uncultured Jatrophihabitans sp.]|uniref:endonuclease/exonuclease/phosphatase family protein n=1 Tax=uncultured Jatrophihabitans sp. TaxID=1610747 RepID=UPI0035CA41A2